ncbi:MAG: hypothetical protein LBL07_10360 [Tannerella sp.]|jgi:hypothetical protein|nr:hypothetical protein [Tannerella sp.]
MNINEFLKKFLPDYEAKKQACHPDEEFYTGVTFKDKHFPEALQNFADRICEEQRGSCRIAYRRFADDYYEGGYDYDLYLTIRDCEQPEIDRL